jgi:hypothetical protein
MLPAPIYEKLPNWARSVQRLVRAGMREFDPFHSSHAFLRSASLPRRRENGPEIPAFCAFVLVSGVPVCRTRGGNRRKSPAVSANIPVLGETIGGDRFDQDCRATTALDFEPSDTIARSTRSTPLLAGYNAKCATLAPNAWLKRDKEKTGQSGRRLRRAVR